MVYLINQLRSAFYAIIAQVTYILDLQVVYLSQDLLVLKLKLKFYTTFDMFRKSQCGALNGVSNQTQCQISGFISVIKLKIDIKIMEI